jgi:hypothetical protein
MHTQIPQQFILASHRASNAAGLPNSYSTPKVSNILAMFSVFGGGCGLGETS